MKESVYILGKSNYALSIILDILKLNQYSGTVYIVPNLPESQNTSSKYLYLSSGLNVQEVKAEEFNNDNNQKLVLGSIGKGRSKIFEHFHDTHSIQASQFINIIHSSAVVSETSKLGYGVHISPLSVVSPFAELGNFSIVNRNVSIGHHTVLEEFACLNPGVNIAGICQIGPYTTIGIGATIIDSIKIGSNSIIGAGSLVTKDIPDNVLAYGVPAKIIRSL
jgi:sugar O-acyltransferase (sialic acid O-acetyltransferase NeuD family)